MVDLDSLEVRTLKLTGVPSAKEPIAPRSVRLADLPGTPTIRTEPLRLAKGKDGALTLSLKLPADHKYTEAAGSRWQVIADEEAPVSIVEAKASGALTGNQTITIPVQLKDGAKEGVVRVEAIAYFCKDEGACQVSGVLFEIPVALGHAAEKPLELKHTFNSQVAQFGLPLSQEEN